MVFIQPKRDQATNTESPKFTIHKVSSEGEGHILNLDNRTKRRNNAEITPCCPVQ